MFKEKLRKQKKEDLSTVQNPSLNSNNVIVTSTNNGACGCFSSCLVRGQYNSGSYNELGFKSEYMLRVKHTCKWCCCIGTFVFAIVLIIIFASYLPNTAQNSIDNAQLIQEYMALMQPTNDSITINATMLIVNSGQYDATVHPTTATVRYNGIVVGTFAQPQLEITGGKGGSIQLTTPIDIRTKVGLNAFRNMSAEILLGNDVTVTFESSLKVTPKLMGITLPSVNGVSMKKEIILPGAKMQKPFIKNISVEANSTGTVVVMASEIEFSVASTLRVFGGKLSVLLYDEYNNNLGHAVIPDMKILPGYNKLTPLTAFLGYCDNCSNETGWNNNSIDTFVQNYGMGIDQILNMRGPIGDLVISNTLNQNAIAYGVCYGPGDWLEMEQYYDEE